MEYLTTLVYFKNKIVIIVLYYIVVEKITINLIKTYSYNLEKVHFVLV